MAPGQNQMHAMSCQSDRITTSQMAQAIYEAMPALTNHENDSVRSKAEVEIADMELADLRTRSADRGLIPRALGGMPVGSLQPAEAARAE